VSRIDFCYEEIKPLKIPKKILKKHIQSLIKAEGKKPGDITVVFCSDDYLLEINKQHLNHDYFTDIITFDYVENDIISGDLFISIDTISENAAIYENSFLSELFRVVFHGVLHLNGFKDKSEEDVKLMREKENYYLSEVDFSEIEK
jgi:rRNA maturation RNase YbeY